MLRPRSLNLVYAPTNRLGTWFAETCLEILQIELCNSLLSQIMNTQEQLHIKPCDMSFDVRFSLVASCLSVPIYSTLLLTVPDARNHCNDRRCPVSGKKILLNGISKQDFKLCDVYKVYRRRDICLLRCRPDTKHDHF